MGTSENKLENFFTIETHYGVSENFVRANTRNQCSEDLVIIIKEIARILYPDDYFDIYLLPPEPGSYKDILKFVKKNKLGLSAATTITIGGLVLGFLNYQDSHETHLHEMKTAIVSDVANCLDLSKTMEELKEKYDIENVPQEKIAEVCGNINLKKRKNNFYNTLNQDDMIIENETVLRDEENQTIFSKKIEKNEFSKYIETISNQDYLQENIEGVIELISPVVKQKKEGKGIPWRGTYYGEDVFYDNIPILKNGEDMDFYMQDSEFKDKIYNKERTFAIGDNMRIIFNITGEIKGGLIQNRNIYIKEVKNYNEDIIIHKTKSTKNSDGTSNKQISIFDIK
jgi:hypothetical protein